MPAKLCPRIDGLKQTLEANIDFCIYSFDMSALRNSSAGPCSDKGKALEEALRAYRLDPESSTPV